MPIEDDGRHLTEEERQGLADDSLPLEQRLTASAHLEHCAACAGDVARLRALMAHVGAEPQPTEALDDLWPAIRERIEQGKIAALPVAQGQRRTHSWQWVILTGVAAALTVFALLQLRPTPAAPVDAPPTRTDVMTVALVDSSSAYQQQVATLLDELELRRAMLPPATVARVDHDLRTIDHAIAELRDALAHDPNDPALRQLLAASLRQKRDLLQRVNNAS